MYSPHAYFSVTANVSIADGPGHLWQFEYLISEKSTSEVAKEIIKVAYVLVVATEEDLG